LCAHTFKSKGVAEHSLSCPRCNTNYALANGHPRQADLVPPRACTKCGSPVEVVLYVAAGKSAAMGSPTWGPDTVASIICNGTKDTHSMLHTLKASWTDGQGLVLEVTR